MEAISRLPAWLLEGYIGVVFVLIIVIILSAFMLTSSGKVTVHKAHSLKIVFSVVVIIFSIISAIIGFLVFWEKAFGSLSSTNSLDFISEAVAATEQNVGKSFDVISFVIFGIFCVMFIAYLAAIYVYLFAEETDENKKRRDAADNIVKTFGGFFVGIATAYVNQAIGKT